MKTLSLLTFKRPVPLMVLALILLGPLHAQAESKNTSVSSDYVGILETRLQTLEEQVRTLTGEVEQANYQAKQAQDRVQRLQEDIETRFRMMQSGADSGAVSPNTPSSAHVNAPTDSADAAGSTENTADQSPSSGHPTPLTPNVEEAQAQAEDEKVLGQLMSGEDAKSLPDNPNAAYDLAFSKVRDHDYEAAESLLRAFLKRWPNHDLASNATYWLAETFYVRGDYTQAARYFAESYQKYPKGTKAEDTLIKLGLTLSALNRTNDACVTLGQAMKEFPDMSTSNRRRVDQEQKSLECP